jgi:hypothetical protein
LDGGAELKAAKRFLPDSGALSNIGWGWLSCNPYEDFETNGDRLPIDGGGQVAARLTQHLDRPKRRREK